ncbi:MAG: DUF4038 domain-containing protein [Bacteroides sp.]|nr:DUF4038 domain-containing protein [Bacteroides sp.]
MVINKEFWIVYLLLGVLSVWAVNAATPPLGISADGRYFIEKKSGKPVFILADTAWNLAALEREEIDLYLQNRAGNGFNTIMFTLNFYPQAKAENAYGEAAYVGKDHTQLNPSNLVHVDYIVE